MKSYYGITLLEVGPNRQQVLDLLIKWYPNDSKSTVEEILNQIEKSGEGTVLDCLSKAEADDALKTLQSIGATAEIYEMPEDEVADAIECGDIVEESEGASERKSEGSNLSPMQKYQETTAELWRLLLFCMAGWAIATIGFCTLPFNDIFGFLLVIAGVVVVDIPCFKALRAGYSLASLFAASGAVYEITYKSGRKQYDYSEKNMGYVMAIFTYVITIIVGVFIMVFKLLKTFLHAVKLKNENNLKVEFKDSHLFKLIIALAVFVLGFVAMAIANGVAEKQRTHPTDMTKEEIVSLMDDAVTNMKVSDWSVRERSYNSETNVYEDTLIIMHEGDDNSYYVKIGDTKYAKELFKIDAGEYLYFEGTWHKITDLANKQYEDTKFADALNIFLIENMVDLSAIKADSKQAFGKQLEYDKSYEMFYHRSKKDGGMLQVRMTEEKFINYISGAKGIDLYLTIYQGLTFGEKA